MNGEEPYRWLEAIRNRREYIEDRLQGGTAVVAIQSDSGILLMTAKASTPKLFEIYDQLALGCLGHPADLEKIRQAAIDAAHLEGFTRSRHDVNSRRLINYNLGPLLKTAFEQIFAAPFMFRGLLAEVESDPSLDTIWVVDYDGTYHAARPSALPQGVLITGRKETQRTWENLEGKPDASDRSLKARALVALQLLNWVQQVEKKDQKLDRPETKSATELLPLFPDGLEYAFLDRSLLEQPIAYRIPSLSELGFGE